MNYFKFTYTESVLIIKKKNAVPFFFKVTVACTTKYANELCYALGLLKL
jgi:hypothetical protein